MTSLGPGAVRLEPMTWDDFDAWRPRSMQGFARQQVDAGLRPAPEAEAEARRQLEELLPSGLATPLHHQWTVRGPDDVVVGRLWLRLRPLSSEEEAFVFDVEVEPAARGRGVGRATMLAAEEVARSRGADVVRLNVFGHNTAARRLYDGLGYAVATAHLTRSLDPVAPPSPVAGPEVVLQDLAPERLPELVRRLRNRHARAIAASGALPAEEAAARAASEVAQLVPENLGVPGHLLLEARTGGGASGGAGDRLVGEAWLQLWERSDGRHAHVHHLSVREELRGRGHGRAVLAAVLGTCRGLGATSMASEVFGFDEASRRLYAGAGFEVTAQRRVKRL